MILTSTIKPIIAGNLALEASADTYTKYQVLANITEAQRWVMNVVPLRFIDTAIKSVLGDLELGVNLYQWPLDCGRWVELRLDYVEGITAVNRGYKARVKESPDASSIYSTPRETDPVMCPAFEGGFEIYPVPGANVKEGYRLKYKQNLPAVTDSQNSLLNEMFQNLVVFKATELCALTEGYSKSVAANMHVLAENEVKSFN
ncbi:MAG: hypothetical protein WC957_00830 [Candidatus Neomarinimicrobiota bacterium]|jgi:hypothetical protein